MSKRTVEFFLLDVYIAILKIKKVVLRFHTHEELLYSYTDWDSIIRELEIIGEATKHLVNNEMLDKQYQIIVDFRNQITHKYFGIDSEIVWSVIHNDLKKFENTIVDMISELPDSIKNELIASFKEDNKYLEFIVKSLNDLQKREK